MLFDTYPFELPPLSYPYEALEPYIDAKTMHLHHDRHFATYVANLNKALEPYPKLQCLTLFQILTRPGILPKDARTVILRNAGGVYNHYLYFEKIGPPCSATRPTGKLAEDIDRTFGSFEKFKGAFSQNAAGVFGSGWTYLVRLRNGVLAIVNTPNQETPLPSGACVIMLIDVWEHAYYLKYKNARNDYIAAFWNVAHFSE